MLQALVMADLVYYVDLSWKGLNRSPAVRAKFVKMTWLKKIFPLPVVVLSEPASYTLSRRWLCSLGWLRRCSPDRRLQWYSHWWGSHSFQRQLHNKTNVSHINYPLPSQYFIFVSRKKKIVKSVLPTFWFNHIVVPNFQSLRYCEWSAKAIHCW